MLCRQNLRGRHQRRLVSVFHGHQHGLQRHNGLARPHIALQQAAHGARLAHVGHNLAQAALLRRRGMKRQYLADGLAHFVRGRERNAHPVPHPPPLQFQPQFEKKQLFENQPAMGGRPRRLQLRHGRAFSREVHRAQRRLAIRKLQPRQHVPGQAFRNAAPHGLQQPEDHLALPARRQPRASQRFVHRGDPSHFQQPRLRILSFFRQNLELRLNHFQIAAGPRWFHLSEHGHRLSRMEAVLQIRAVEPHALQRQASLAQGHFENRHAPRLKESRSPHFRNHAGRFARLQLIDAARILAVFITKGKVIEKVFGSLDVFRGELRRNVRSHSPHIHHLRFKSGHILDAKAWKQLLAFSS